MSDGEREYDVEDLVDSEVTLTHWTGPDDARTVLDGALRTRTPEERGRVSGLVGKSGRTFEWPLAKDV